MWGNYVISRSRVCHRVSVLCWTVQRQWVRTNNQNHHISSWHEQDRAHTIFCSTSSCFSLPDSLLCCVQTRILTFSNCSFLFPPILDPYLLLRPESGSENSLWMWHTYVMSLVSARSPPSMWWWSTTNKHFVSKVTANIIWWSSSNIPQCVFLLWTRLWPLPCLTGAGESGKSTIVKQMK